MHGNKVAGASGLLAVLFHWRSESSLTNKDGQQLQGRDAGRTCQCRCDARLFSQDGETRATWTSFTEPSVASTLRRDFASDLQRACSSSIPVQT